ncbi:MAG: CHASE2 domain-containing protein, partial [Cyanobacteria bacterium J06632_22]
MGKRVVLKVGKGDFTQGFPVILQIGEAGALPSVESRGQLPPAPDLPMCYSQWRTAYRSLRLPHRLGIRPDSVQHVSWAQDCRDAARQLCDRTAVWLNHPDFQPLYSKLLEQLSPEESIQLVLQTEEATLRRLPWHHWDFFDRYPKAELTLSAPFFEQGAARPPRRRNVRVLAVFGDGTGLDLKTDRALLKTLPGIELCMLTAPSRHRLNQCLWDARGWDILFFAGHSNSVSAEEGYTSTHAAGQIGLNPQDSLTIPDLKYALRKAVKRGLAIAIFNSCDGLGLAQDLAELQIPQVLVMREPVPDPVAHAFLKGFLRSFARNTPLHLAVRDAREQLQGLEDRFPCAAWLPVLCQNLAQPPPTWSSLQGGEPLPRRPWRLVAGGVAAVGATLGVDLYGGFQGLELKAYDFFLRHRLGYEQRDERLVIIENTTADIERFGIDASSGASMRDDILLALVERLAPLEPKVVGLDIYHPHAFNPALPELPTQLNALPNLALVCKHPAPEANLPGVAFTEAITPDNRLGFSDFLEDGDTVTRRQLLVTELPEETRCPAEYSFAVAIAVQYLALADARDPLDTVLWPLEAKARLQFRQTLLPPIRPRFGGYQLVEAESRGYQMMINYRHLPNLEDIAARRLTVSDVLNGDFNPEDFAGKIVLIGTTDFSFGGGDIEDRDLWITPYHTSERAGERLSGVFLQAHLVSQLLSAVEDNRPLISSWHESVERMWITVWGGVGLLVGGRLYRNSLRPRFWVGLISAEIVLVLLCWGLLTGVALWVPWAPAAPANAIAA